MHAQQSLAMYYSGVGEFEKAISKFEVTILKAREVGDFRRAEEAVMFLSMVYFLQGTSEDILTQGTFTRAMRLVNEAIASANQRGDTQLHVLALTFRARLFSAQQDALAMEESLEMIENSFKNRTAVLKDVSANLLYNALWARLHLEKGELSAAYNYATQLEDLLRTTEPTTFFSMDCYQR